MGAWLCVRVCVMISLPSVGGRVGVPPRQRPVNPPSHIRRADGRLWVSNGEKNSYDRQIETGIKHSITQPVKSPTAASTGTEEKRQ